MLKAKYIRISTQEQNIDRQLNEEYALYIDKISGLVPFEKRPAGKKLMEDIKKERVNCVVIHSIDRLGRNIVDIQHQLNWFINNRIQVFCENIQMNLLNDDGSVNMITKMILDVLSSVASMELEAIQERQSQGIRIAKAKGVYQGRKVGAVMTKDSYLERHKDVIALLKDGLSVSKTSKLTGKAYVTVKRVNETYFELC